ncbi:MAG: beta-N-acetylhexosaminidase [Streptosporangiaceae bacterium]
MRSIQPTASDPAGRQGAVRRSWVRRSSGRLRAALAGMAAVVTITAMALAGTFGGPAGARAAQSTTTRDTRVLAPVSSDTGAPQPAAPEIVPKPVSMTVGSGAFVLQPGSRIIVGPGAASGAWAVAQDLTAYLRSATGYALPVTIGRAGQGDIMLQLVKASAFSPDPNGEGYRLDSSAEGVTLQSATAHGLYDGVQTLRQLFPAWINSSGIQPGPWVIPVVHITDYPRYGYRGLMIDIARHFETPQTVEQMISQAAAYKIDVLHLHLSDDQGFRIVVPGFPRLTEIGGRGAVGTDGQTMDTGGYWTRAQYEAVVADAAAHFMTVVPEVDSPGHNNAIIMSEYGDTSNPLLRGNPEDINCSVHNPPQWNYTEDVGYSAVCPNAQNSYIIYSAIIHDLTAMSPGPLYDLGGDEVPATLLSPRQYAIFINRESKIVTATGKTVMGWADIAGPYTKPPKGSIAEYWDTASGTVPSTNTAREAVRKGMKLVMAPAEHTYLDQKYLAGKAGNQPPVLGLSWACPTGCDVSAAYNWNPGSLVTGVPANDVIGVEGAIWGETVTNLSEIEYMVFPRLLALAEVAWSPAVNRTSPSPAYKDFLTRLSAQGARLQFAGANFYPSTEVPWQLDVEALHVSAPGGEVQAPLARVSAPGLDMVTATVNWGDGQTSPAVVTGQPRGQGETTVNGLYTVLGQHEYSHPGVYQGTITVSATGTPSVTVPFTVSWQG